MLVGDSKNSVLFEVDQEVRQEIVYTPYGHRVGDDVTSSLSAYNGERCEAQTECYALGNGYRTYNPQLMRFHSPDSWSPFGAGGLNAYTYCLGDPISFTDKTGHMIGSFLRLFRTTTASPVASNLSAGLTYTPKKRPATLQTVTEKHVDRLGKTALLREESATQTYQDMLAVKSTRSSGDRRDRDEAKQLISSLKEQYEKQAKLEASAKKDYFSAVDHLGKKGITRYAAARAKKLAERYDKNKTNEVNDRRAKSYFDIQAQKIRNKGNERNYLGNDRNDRQ